MSHRVHIEHSFEGTVAYFEKDDLVVREAVKGAGFRFSRNVGGWYLNSRWSEPTRRGRVGQVVRQFEADEVEVEDGGRAPQTSAAEREEVARERAAERAERLDARAEKLDAASDAAWKRGEEIGKHIPFGQPILVGHHSERGHRKALATIEASGRKAVELGKEADAAARSAEIARRAADGTPLITRQRRIERKSAELRDIERRIAGASSEDYRVRMEEIKATLVDEIEHDKAVVAASGKKVYSKADVSKGDVVIVRGRPRKVARVNAKSVSVETGYSWTDTVPYHEISKVIPVTEQPAAAS